jgi:hypothetical protein
MLQSCVCSTFSNLHMHSQGLISNLISTFVLLVCIVRKWGDNPQATAADVRCYCGESLQRHKTDAWKRVKREQCGCGYEYLARAATGSVAALTSATALRRRDVGRVLGASRASSALGAARTKGVLLGREQDVAVAGGERKREAASGKDAASIPPEFQLVRAECRVVRRRIGWDMSTAISSEFPNGLHSCHGYFWPTSFSEIHY